MSIEPHQNFTGSDKNKCNRLHFVKKVRIQSFSGLYFLAFGLTTVRYLKSLRIQSKCGKIRIRKTLNADSFFPVLNLLKFWHWRNIYQKFYLFHIELLKRKILLTVVNIQVKWLSFLKNDLFRKIGIYWKIWFSREMLKLYHVSRNSLLEVFIKRTLLQTAVYRSPLKMFLGKGVGLKFIHLKIPFVQCSISLHHCY